MVTKKITSLEKSIRTMSAKSRANRYAFTQIWPFGLVCNLIELYERQTKTQPPDRGSTFPLGCRYIHFLPTNSLFFHHYSTRSLPQHALRPSRSCGRRLGNGFYLPTSVRWTATFTARLIKSIWVGRRRQGLVRECVDAIKACVLTSNTPKPLKGCPAFREGDVFMAAIKIGWAGGYLAIGIIGRKCPSAQCTNGLRRRAGRCTQFAMVVENDEGVCADSVALDLALNSDKMLIWREQKLAELTADFPARS
jgi:hypothetical protein